MPDEHPRPRPLVVVMGVAGSGKTTVGSALAERLCLDYADADEFHSQANVAKMAAGHPLDDDDRSPWLGAIGQWLAAHEDTGGVASCSALRRHYRDALRLAAPRVHFLHLDGDPRVVTQRVADRPGHFMPASLVSSQLELLERLEADEIGSRLDLTAPVDDIVADFTRTLALTPTQHLTPTLHQTRTQPLPLPLPLPQTGDRP